MREFINTKAGMSMPDEFIEIAILLEKRFGSKEIAIQKLGYYLGYACIENVNEIWGYQGVPFEALLPLGTGGNGEHLG